MGAFWLPRPGTQVMLITKCQSQTPTTLMLQWQILFADTGCKRREPLPLHQFSHCGHLSVHQTAVKRIVLEKAPWCFSANSLCSV